MTHYAPVIDRFSKLPIRQSTILFTDCRMDAVSKLPIRQSTISLPLIAPLKISKLPIRQSTITYFPMVTLLDF